MKSIHTSTDDDIESVASSTGRYSGSEDERDEIREVQRMALHDTRLVRGWRMVVLSVIIATAIAVCITTLNFLRDEEKNDFRSAFLQFASTVEVSALEQQQNIREAFLAMANVMTAFSSSANATWPFFTLPFFELHGANLRKHSLIEALWIANKVTHQDRDDYIDYITERYIADAEESLKIDPSGADSFKAGFYEPYFRIRTENGLEKDFDREIYLPLWQQSPPRLHYGHINYNLLGVSDYQAIMDAGDILKNETVFTRVRPYSAFSQEDHAKLHSSLPNQETDHPHSFVFHPIHADVANDESPIVAYVLGATAWDTALRNIMPAGVKGIYAVISNNCNQSFTYLLDGPDAFFLGDGDLHETEYDDLVEYVDLMALRTHPKFLETPGHCSYELRVYPGKVFEESYNSDTPELFALIVGVAFIFMIFVFFIYDLYVNRRNRKLVANAARSNAIVSSLFPSNIRDRLIGINADPNGGVKTLKKFMHKDNEKGGVVHDSKPLADLFLESTILFADIVGFTAWSSVREPASVFTLLETVFSSFDSLAKKRRIFKIETVGDCYVAASGIPDPRADHASVMIRFAQDILACTMQVTKQLEVTLGPDTGDLSLRIGVHSGPVTAGVLRGERARFQLFGDTMNATARIESTGAAGRIHVSHETADLLNKAGKGHWIVKREESIVAKGKGDMQTYWVVDGFGSGHYNKEGEEEDSSESQHMTTSEHMMSQQSQFFVEADTQRTQRLIDWNVGTLSRLVKEIVARRQAQIDAGVLARPNPASQRIYVSKLRNRRTEMSNQPLDEVQEIIALPEFDSNVARLQLRPDDITLETRVMEQLSNYVTCVANMYRENSFHNFEHASHVTMSVIKLLSRIVAPTEILEEHEDEDESEDRVAATLHDHTYGITSDPLTRFACAFSALIHDVDHVGVPNAQLIKEQSPLATAYKSRSVAEQNSLVLAWDLLLGEEFSDLLSTICATEQELLRFRGLIVGAVMATDIADKDLKALRNDRWDKAFADLPECAEVSRKSQRDSVNRKATIVIEHLIQASDVSHTMQHWHVYRKWNERFFIECYKAYKDGRADIDPSTNWYKGELGFFDFYIIPLAKKLKDCGVFGKSSDEYLNYAVKNRAEWELRGQEVLAEMMAKTEVDAEHGS